MIDCANYKEWLQVGSWIRITARAIIFNATRDKILVETGVGSDSFYHNFIGGGLEIGETLEACVLRELEEEVEAGVVSVTYRFACENFYHHAGQVRHSMGHYFEVVLDRDDVYPKEPGVEYVWCPIAELGSLDLRPFKVRDAIRDGSFSRINHLVA